MVKFKGKIHVNSIFRSNHLTDCQPIQIMHFNPI